MIQKLCYSLLVAIVGGAAMAGTTPAATQSHTSGAFAGVKVNGGTVAHTMKDNRHVLTLSADFQVPDTPDPHWQVVDSNGEVFLLDRLGVKNLAGLGKDRINTSITLPAGVRDVAKVQIYCAWAEAVLGEATFPAPVQTRTP